MPSNKAMAFIERVKNEIHQKRIPNKTGGGQNIMDAAYNPLSQIEDYFFAQTAEGRGSKVETLPGGQNLGEIDDLKYFNNKLMKGLRIPLFTSTRDDPVQHLLMVELVQHIFKNLDLQNSVNVYSQWLCLHLIENLKCS